MEKFWLVYIAFLSIIFFKFLDSICDSLIQIKNELNRINKMD